MDWGTALMAIEILGALVVLAVLGRWLRSKAASVDWIALDDVEDRVRAFLAHRPGDGSFIVLLTDRSGSDGGPSFAQLSIENNQPGMDHVFTAELNQQTSEAFKDLLESHGETVSQCNANDVAYLRAEVEDGPQWIHRVLREVHGLSPDATVSVIEEHVAR